MNDKDPKKPSEEEIKKLLEQLKKNKSGKNTAISFGFLLHRNYFIHMIISLILNFVISAVVIGLAIGINEPLINMEILGYILAILLLTLLENFIKILLFKYIMRALILSMGLISILIQVIILYAIDLLLPIGFDFNGIEHLFIFSFVFSGFRLIASVYIRRWIFIKKFRFLKGDHK